MIVLGSVIEIALIVLVVATPMAVQFGLLHQLGVSALARRSCSPPERLVRCLVALLGAGLAVAASYSASLDASLELGGGIVLLFALAGVAAVFVAIEVARFGPMLRTPYLGVLVAVGFAALIVVSSPFALAQSACACARPEVPYVPPTLFGVAATGWATFSAITTPALLVAATLGRH